jgi:hypothetical protein
MNNKTDMSPASLDKGEKREIDYERGLELPRGELITIDNGAIEIVTQLASEEEKRILKKVDYRLVPLLAFLYLIAFVDRSNSKYIQCKSYLSVSRCPSLYQLLTSSNFQLRLNSWKCEDCWSNG